MGLDQRQAIADVCKIKSLQTGVMRTNCMDCLDRTNVVQSVFSRKVLHKQLFDLHQSTKVTDEPFEPFEGCLEQRFRDMWTNNAD